MLICGVDLRDIKLGRDKIMRNKLILIVLTIGIIFSVHESHGSSLNPKLYRIVKKADIIIVGTLIATDHISKEVQVIEHKPNGDVVFSDAEPFGWVQTVSVDELIMGDVGGNAQIRIINENFTVAADGIPSIKRNVQNVIYLKRKLVTETDRETYSLGDEPFYTLILGRQTCVPLEETWQTEYLEAIKRYVPVYTAGSDIDVAQGLIGLMKNDPNPKLRRNAELNLLDLRTDPKKFHSVTINEVFADPPAGLAGDANNDGYRHRLQDEFVEIVNNSDGEVDLSGWKIYDSEKVRHEFPYGITLKPDECLVVFGGGEPQDIPCQTYIASTGAFDFDEPGDAVTLKDQGGNIVDKVTYPYPGGFYGFNQSIVRKPERYGKNFTFHTELSYLRFSPGRRTSGGDWHTGELPPSTEQHLIINEIMANPGHGLSDFQAEWFELYNNTDETVDLYNYTIRDDGSDLFKIDKHVDIEPFGFAVLGICGDIRINGGVPLDYEYKGFALANSSDEIIVIDANGNEVDRVEYNGPFPVGNGSSFMLDNPEFDNNDGSNWVSATLDYGDGSNDGTPGQPNNIVVMPRIDIPLTLPAEPGDLIITEIMQNPRKVYDSRGEWFEIYNNANHDINLNGLWIKDNGSNRFRIQPTRDWPNTVIPAGEFFVLARVGDTTVNGGVETDYDYSGSFALGNSDDEIIILAGSSIIDKVEYDGGPNFPDPNGASMTLIDFSKDNNLGHNWITDTDYQYGLGDYGTPGYAILRVTFRVDPPHIKINHGVITARVSNVSGENNSLQDIDISTVEFLGAPVSSSKIVDDELHLQFRRDTIVEGMITHNELIPATMFGFLKNGKPFTGTAMVIFSEQNSKGNEGQKPKNDLDK
jgi:hypothetical protein